VREAVLACADLWPHVLCGPPALFSGREDHVEALLTLFRWSLENDIVASSEVVDQWLPCVAQTVTVRVI
jgi:hypothetical protein